MEELDDVLFSLKVITKVKDKSGNPSEMTGANPGNWDKEDEKMKRRIERSSIN